MEPGNELRRKLRAQRNRMGENPHNTSLASTNDLDDALPKRERCVAVGSVKMRRQQFEGSHSLGQSPSRPRRQNHWLWDPDPPRCPPPSEVAGSSVHLSFEEPWPSTDYEGNLIAVPPPARLPRSPGALQELLRSLPETGSPAGRPSWIGTPGLSVADPTPIPALDLDAAVEGEGSAAVSSQAPVRVRRSLWSALESPIDQSVVSSVQEEHTYDNGASLESQYEGLDSIWKARLDKEAVPVSMSAEDEPSMEEPSSDEERMEPMEYVVLDYLHSLPPAFVKKLKVDIEARDHLIERLRQRNRELKKRPAESKPRKMRRSLTAPSLPTVPPPAPPRQEKIKVSMSMEQQPKPVPKVQKPPWVGTRSQAAPKSKAQKQGQGPTSRAGSQSPAGPRGDSAGPPRNRRSSHVVDLSQTKATIERLSGALNTSMEMCRRRDEEAKALAYETIMELQAMLQQR
mmetsp:Transcript_58770/g.108480  ORF Transcript_58770/g.108480 Transcript_58770/m.108480 type:complete len:457 (-) Transcript_58770:165-1535(-)